MTREHGIVYLDQSHKFTSELYDKLNDALGGRLICDFGAGCQGSAFLDERGFIVKATRSAEEAALARYLQLHPASVFAEVSDVRRVKIDDVPITVITREFATELIEDPNEDELVQLSYAQSAWHDIHLLRRNSTESIEYLSSTAPNWVELMTRFHRDLAKYEARHGIYVADVHFDNIGLSQDVDRLIAFDFGMNNFLRKMGPALLDDIPELELLCLHPSI